jgi:hypothetical protein
MRSITKLLTRPQPPVQTAPCRATPCGVLLRRATATCWGSRRQRRAEAAVGQKVALYFNSKKAQNCVRTFKRCRRMFHAGL